MKNYIFGASFATLLFVGLVILTMWGCPRYKVYQRTMSGRSVLAEAESSRMVAIAEAKAKMESAALLAQADTIRAHGVAESNRIIGMSLKDNDAYLKWLWIENIEKNPQAIIYIPTENGMPILESTRLLKKDQPAE